MTTLYYTSSNSSCRKSIQWFKEHDIKVREKNVKYISKKELIQILALSKNGFVDILKCPSRSEYLIQAMIEEVLNMSFQGALDFVLKHTEILKTPLILNEDSLIIGYNVEEIRTFIPKENRKFYYYS